MEGLATDLVRFFYADVDNTAHDELRFRSLSDFVNEEPGRNETLNLGATIMLCDRLAREGYLLHQNSQDVPLLGNRYWAVNFSERRAAYGEYEFVANGFAAIANALSPAVLPVIVTDNKGNEDCGTAFFAGNGNTLFTARHVVEGMKEVRIPTPSGQPLKILKVLFHPDPSLDVAVISVDSHTIHNLKPLQTSRGSVLDDVLCVGYPPIPGFESVKSFEKAEINSSIRRSTGQIVGDEKSYLDDTRYFLLNTAVKGGSSGGPVINAKGYVVGMLIAKPANLNGTGSIEMHGFGIAIPSESMIQMLDK